jgi:hypothetical protein
MKRLSLLSVLAFSLFVTAFAYAETIEGSVVSVDPANNSIQLTKNNAAGNAEKVNVTVKEGTRFSGVQSLDDLKPGDTVKVEADQNFFTRAWSATSVQTSGTSEAIAEPSPIASASPASEETKTAEDSVAAVPTSTTTDQPADFPSTTFDDSTATTNASATETGINSPSPEDRTVSEITDSTQNPSGANNTSTESVGAPSSEVESVSGTENSEQTTAQR